MNEDALKKLTDELQSGINAIRDKQTTLENAKLDKSILDKELQPTIEKVQKKVDELEVGLRKVQTTSTSTGEKSAEHKAFVDWLRFGTPSDLLRKAGGMESKVMKISDATTGGYLASPEITQDLLKNIVEYSPIRSVASVRTTGRESIIFRKRTGTLTANWTGEVATKTETTGWTFGVEQIPVHELYAMVDISNWDLEDSDFNLEAELNSEFGEQFGVAEANAFVSGNVTGKPQGLLVNANVGTANSGDANNITADGLITAYFTPKSAYTRNLKWLMARGTMAYIAKLKNNDNDYLLRRLGETPVWTILGSDVVECVDMPAMANNAYSVVFGDFRQGYLIVDRIAMSVMRDPYSAATSGAVRFHARKRVGGQVIKPEAIYKIIGKA